MTPMLWTSAPDRPGSDRVYLDQLGGVSGLRYAFSYPGGAKSAQATLGVPATFMHRALSPGRDCGVTVGGGDIWTGTLDVPTISDDGSRSLTAVGDGAMTQHWIALGLGSHNALNANEVIDAAQLSARHSRFWRVDDLPVQAGAFAADASFSMDEALTQNATAAGKRWRLDRDRVIRYYPIDGDGTRLMLRARQDIARTLDGFATILVGVYIDAATGLRQAEHHTIAPELIGETVLPEFYNAARTGYASKRFTLYSDGVTITAYVVGAPAGTTVLSLDGAADLNLLETSQFYSRFAAAGDLTIGSSDWNGTFHAVLGGPSLGVATHEGIVHRGRGSLGPIGHVPPREAVVDLTAQGAFTLPEALDQLAGAHEKMTTQPPYEGSWTVQYGDLLSPGGVPVDLSTVQAGVQALVLAADASRSLTLLGSTDVVTIGETEYDVDTQTLTLTPAATPELADRQAYVDPATGLKR